MLEKASPSVEERLATSGSAAECSGPGGVTVSKFQDPKVAPAASELPLAHL